MENQCVQIALLGPLEVRAGPGRPVEVAGARLRRLLILLALEPGRVVTASRLVDGLWGDEPPAAAANALQALVSRLRRAAPELPVESRPAGYRLAIAPDDVDVPRFERLAAAGRAQLRDDPAGAAATLRAALALWRGPALADVADAEFARAPIARLTELWLTSTEYRIAAELRLGAGPSLVAELTELVAGHPLREPLIGGLMRALAAAGRPSAALSAYEQARGRLAAQLGVDPSPELAGLHLALLRGERIGPVSEEGAAIPAPREPVGRAGGPRTNLRTELSSFVGRAEEARRVGKLLEDSRLVTLTGPGGAGKTRLAIEAARPLADADQSPDGVWLVELAPVTDPAEVASAALAALGLREQALLGRGRLAPVEQLDPTDRLAGGLAGRRLLLVLDNCEHLIEAAAALADRILGECPGVRVLATSREPLGITGETLWPVEPLALPPPDVDAAGALDYPAVQLLADRAAAARPGFGVDEDNVADVVRICRSLDGMPLAIELAAARFRSMTTGQVAARLDDRFRLLTAGSRTALPRHRTLAAVVDWSWGLLDEAEQALWRRFAIFTGGATPAAAERVCAGPPVPADQVADLLTALVDKSLLVPIGTVEPRYRMLETIRAYGLDRLDAAGERAAVRSAHAAYYLELAEIAGPELAGRDQLRWLALLTEEHDNAHAALQGAIAAGDKSMAVRLVAALGWYWWLRGHRAEGAELTTAALDLPGDAPPRPLAMAYTYRGLSAFAGGGHELSVTSRWLDLAAEAASAVPPGEEDALLRLLGPFHAMFRMENEHAMELLRRRYEDPDPWVAAMARSMHTALMINFGGGQDEARADGEEALRRFEALGERWGTSLSLGVLAQLTGIRGDHAASAGFYQRSLALAGELGTQEDAPQLLGALAVELLELGDLDGCRAALAEGHRIAGEIGMAESRSAIAFSEADVARRTGDLATARLWLDRAAEVASTPGVASQWRAAVAALLGQLDAIAGDMPSARARLADGVQTALASMDAPILALVLVPVADYLLRRGEPERAAVLLGATEGILGLPEPAVPDRPRLAAAARAVLGDERYQAAYERGRRATMADVADLAALA
jgi:predicted ATPase/DNA-binding SARP family transcriptional activator